ncbi:diacylglycerol kinase family protein [Fretibacter rubidus]|uniref:diacylglycerol kinase family protein n=1 Tax=Fretibacter rubidus TaxID=570162 RepID=UPI00352B409F
MTAPAPVFIVNNLSETVAKRGSILRTVASDTKAVLYDNDIFDTLDTIVKETHSKSRDHVFIEGGDGTCQGVITAFMAHYAALQPLPRFTLVPGGMTNQVAGVIGMKRPTAQKIKALLAGQFTHEKLPLITVTSGSNSVSYNGFLFSTGAIPMITQYTKQKLHKRGIGGSPAVIGGIVRGVSGQRADVMHPTPITLTIDGGTPISDNHLGTVLTTLPSLFKGLDPFWGEGDGELRLTYAKGDARRLLSNIVSLWRGQKNIDRTADGLSSYNASQIDFNYAGDVVLDGETLDLLGPKFTVTPSRPVSFLW